LGLLSLLGAREIMRCSWGPNIGQMPYFTEDLSLLLSRAAKAAASARVLTPSLERTWLTWCEAVLGVM
jgi:hypothetical protein